MELFADNYKTMKDGICTGLALLGNFEQRVSRTNSPYLVGVLHSGDLVFPFKIWNGDFLQSLLTMDLTRKGVFEVSGKFGFYQGNLQLTLTSGVPCPDVSVDFVCPKKYPSDLLDKMFASFSKIAPSPVVDLFKGILTDSDVIDRLLREYAGKSQHDAIPSGLLGHTFKCFRSMVALMQWYPEPFETLASRDDGTSYINSKWIPLFVVGLHDLGKIWEYSDGEFTDISWASHRVLLINYLAEHYRGDLEQVFGEKGYLRVLSAIAQHHGEYEERPRTLEGYLVHLVDITETKLTQVSEGCIKQAFPISVDGFYLQ